MNFTANKYVNATRTMDTNVWAYSDELTVLMKQMYLIFFAWCQIETELRTRERI